MQKTQTPTCPVIELHGGPFERGVSYGQQAADRIRLGIDHYSQQLGQSGISTHDLRTAISEFLPLIQAYDPDFIIEMRGIAEGAKVEFDQIILLNARTEILKMARAVAIKNGTVTQQAEPDGCTSIVVMPAASKTGDLLHAQTWDWKVECAETSVILRIHRDDGPDILTFTEAGGLARSGMNSAGICLTANYLESDRDYRQLGVPLALIRRKILATPHLSQAYHAAYVTAKSASNNVTISHRDGVALNFECAPDETFQVHPQNGLIVHANHWQSPIALTKLKDTGINLVPDSLYRDARVREILDQAHGQITIDTIKDALGDAFGSPWGVCRPPHPSRLNNLSATVATLIMEPAKGQMSVAMLPANGAQFETHHLPQEADR